MAKCLYCYKELPTGEIDFHKRCARKIFGKSVAPVLPYSHENIEELAKEVVRSQTAVTGVQPKLSLDFQRTEDGGNYRFTIVGLWGRYILKPQTDLYQSLPELEDLTMHLAEAVGIEVVPHSLIRFGDGQLGYLTRRIDRTDRGEKLPMEDMAQLTERLTEYKYKGSYEQIGKAIEKYSTSPLLDLVNFWQQVVFCWITGNADTHLKNFSIYTPEPGRYQLTPGYDMVSTALVMPEDTEELALTLNGKKRKLRRSDFETAMIRSGLSEKTINSIFYKFIKAREKWNEIIDISFIPSSMKEEYKALITRHLSTLG